MASKLFKSKQREPLAWNQWAWAENSSVQHEQREAGPERHVTKASLPMTRFISSSQSSSRICNQRWGYTYNAMCQHLSAVCVSLWLFKDTEEDEQKLTKSVSLLESQHHHLLHCLEKTTVGTPECPSVITTLNSPPLALAMDKLLQFEGRVFCQ